MRVNDRHRIESILDENRVMTLATLRPDGWPQATTVGYAHSGLDIFFLCGRDSQKTGNLSRDDRVSLTVDHDTPNIMEIRGLSMAGLARRVTAPRRGAAHNHPAFGTLSRAGGFALGDADTGGCSYLPDHADRHLDPRLLQRLRPY